MRETGRVTSVSGSRAEVEVETDGACRHCGAQGVCNWTGTKARRVLALNRAGARPEDVVVLEVPDSGRVKSSLLVFGVPALLMLVGVLTGGLVIGRDLWAGVLAGVGLAAGVLVVKLVDFLVSRSGRTLPVVVRLLDENEPKGAANDEMAGSDSGCGDGKHGQRSAAAAD